MASNTLTENEARQTYLNLAINNSMTRILRDLLSKEISPNNIKQEIPKCTTLKLNSAQKKLIDKANVEGYAKFDVTLLCSLLRNVCPNIQPPTQGWENENFPSPFEKSVGDDVKRIRIFRNVVLAHSSSEAISEFDFEGHWQMMLGICHRMEQIIGGNYVQELQEIRGKTLKPSSLTQRSADETHPQNRNARAMRLGERNIDAVRNENERRIIILGKVGAGKSASGNAILGRGVKVFISRQGWSSVTRECMYGINKRNNLLYRILDTPGANAVDECKDMFHKDIKRCLYVTSPGFHSIVLVISASERLTKEDQKMLKALDDLVGKDASKYMIIIFTKVKDKETLVSLISESKDIVDICIKCDNRYVCFGNDPDNIPTQAVAEFDRMLTEVMEQNAKRKKMWFVHQLYEKAYKIICKDAEDYLKSHPGCDENEALEFAREEAAAGNSPRDSELVSLADKMCPYCSIL